MSSKPSTSFASSRSLDLNSVVVAQQEELATSGEAKGFRDFGGGIHEEDQNTREIVNKLGIEDDLVSKSIVFSEESLRKNNEALDPTIPIVVSDHDLEMAGFMPKVVEDSVLDSKYTPEDQNPVIKDVLFDDLKKDGSSREVVEALKSEPVGENIAPANLGLCSDEKKLQSNGYQECKPGFSFGDMVWGKVRSHPWWPGQIYHPSFASEMALKHHKKGHFLVAYFGDNSFAWNDTSQLKLFEPYFSQMEVQSGLAAFVDAVDESLREVERRVEIGLTCACIEDELIADLKYCVFENAGLIEGTCFPKLDHSLSFEPGRLLDYIQDLAQFPCEKYERLELAKAKGQLKAIYRSKGYPELPEFCFDGGIEHSEVEVLVSESEEAVRTDMECKKGAPLDDTSSKGKKSGRGRQPIKKKQIVEEGRKQKSLPELMKQTEDCANMSDKKVKAGTTSGKKKQIEEDVRKPRSSPSLLKQKIDYNSLNGKIVKVEIVAASKSSRKKRMIRDSDSFGFGIPNKKRPNSLGGFGSLPAYSSRMRALKIGQRISQVANKMDLSPPFRGCNDKKVQKGVRKEKRRTASVRDHGKTPIKEAALTHDYPAPDEMLSQLRLVAQGPNKTHRFLSTVVRFFVIWRDSLATESLDGEKSLNLLQNKRKQKKLAEFDPVLIPMETKSDYMQDSYWSDVIFEESPKKATFPRGRKRKGKSKVNRTKKKIAAGTSLQSNSLEPTLNNSEILSDCSALLKDKQKQGETEVNLSENKIVGTEVNLSDNKIVDECNPAALILNFSDPNALPSVSNLIMIFSQYGPLKEANTEVSRKNRRASVVFKRGADAEVAFSSSGKFSAFGPALLSYRLKYSPSSSPDATPKKDASLTEVGASTLAVKEDSVVLPADGESS